jgi:hypothetical protein
MNYNRLKIHFWPNRLNSNKLILVLLEQGGQAFCQTTFLDEVPEVRYETGNWRKTTNMEVLLAFANNLLLPYRGRVVNLQVANPIGEEGWESYYLDFATDEDKLNFLLAWT